MLWLAAEVLATANNEATFELLVESRAQLENRFVGFGNGLHTREILRLRGSKGSGSGSGRGVDFVAKSKTRDRERKH